MLREISIRDFAIIEQVHLTFDQGFHVLTGETGAGKSILFDALSLVVGGRASADFVRHNAKKATVEALFELPGGHPACEVLEELGLGSDEENLLIRRDISSNGKSTCRINGQIVTLAMLKQVGKRLLDIHGQHEHQRLLQVEEHLRWLDAFGGKELRDCLNGYRKVYGEYRKTTRELEQLNADEKEVAQRIDLLTFQRDEIAAARLTEDEDQELEQEQSRLAHAEHLMQNTAHAFEALYGERQGAELLNGAIGNLEEIVRVDDSMQEVLEMVQSAYFQVEEAARQLGRYRDNLEFDPDRLAQVEERLHLIDELKRKYGESVREVLEHGQRAEQELNQLEHRDEKKAELEEKRDRLYQEVKAKAEALSRLRRHAAAALEREVEKELSDLNMGGTRFSVAFHQGEEPVLTSNGIDQPEFLISPNRGEPLRPLVKIASGGELSRIMLAIQSIFSELEGSANTLIFDEVDTGVSGRAAQAIAEKIARLARKGQVLCVTHLPQVACMADVHFYIFKESDTEKTRTRVRLLTEEGRTLELARMLGGVEVTDTTRNHALEMLRLAEKTKKAM
ncbi:DNA replication and repair protein RecN [Melghirimyces profundicolus]|uniref:DNA repair protein RecN n=1 Tax=Melghirimyces profundicolus TaxID=1242148 RepID=A0A2T6B7Z7_9BACL|nr:DNA repair protein RecN [Melghirimyces profundicolus]PTX52185.1 DNA replication and repair protein RecN [Melghirimyces profundicolus]